METGHQQNLYEDLKKCKDICYEYNHTLPSNEKKREEILQLLLGTLGKDALITQPFYCDFGYNIHIGHHFYANHNCTILDGAKVTIGNHVFIAPNCCIATANHPLDWQQRNQGIEYAEPITIQDNVWIGANVTILSGVTIGKNSVIGAGSLVNKDIPEHVIAVGNPCKVLRDITREDRYDPSTHQNFTVTKE